LLRIVDAEPENQRRFPAPWRGLALAPRAAHATGGLLFVNWQWVPPLRVELGDSETAHHALTSLVASILTGQNPRQTDVLLLGSPESIPPALMALPILRRFIVEPSDTRTTSAAIGAIGALGGERIAQVGSPRTAVVVVFELTELDRQTLAALARLARLGPNAGVQLRAASAQPWVHHQIGRRRITGSPWSNPWRRRARLEALEGPWSVR